jgi:tRNA 2-thiouridine synthesizing protein E
MIAQSQPDPLDARLDAIEAKLDRALEQQRAVAELADAMAPVAKEMMAVASERLERLEQRGYFAAGRELLRIVDTIVTTYGEDDRKALADNVVAILDTLRNVTQPDVLAAANDATDVLRHADEITPLKRLALLRSTGDEDVRRGLTTVVEILRHLGRSSSGHVSIASPDTPSAPRTSSPAPPEPRATPSGERTTVTWEGAVFYDDGFLVDPATWTAELGNKIATGLGLTLGPEHWKVLDWARADYLARAASPNVRRVAAGSGVGTSALYALFPGTPGKTIAMIAGIPKPVGCI